MTKRQIIDDIIVSNPTAPPEFLAQFNQNDLLQYLRHLEVVKTPTLTGDASRYGRYFPTPATAPAYELSVLSPPQRAASSRCPAAVVSPVDADLFDRDSADADLLDIVPDLDEFDPGDPRADTIEFEPIVIAAPAPAAPADQPAEVQPAEHAATADDDHRITYEPDLVAVNAPQHAFDDEQESWLF